MEWDLFKTCSHCVTMVTSALLMVTSALLMVTCTLLMVTIIVCYHR